MCEQEVANGSLVVGHRFDVHQRARKLKKIHKRKISAPFEILWEEAKRKEGTARKRLGLPPLDSASSKVPDDSGQALDLTPNRRGFNYRNDFGGQPVASGRSGPFRNGLSTTSGPFHPSFRS
jgi:hypothetical protein